MITGKLLSNRLGRRIKGSGHDPTLFRHGTGGMVNEVVHLSRTRIAAILIPRPKPRGSLRSISQGTLIIWM